MVRTTRRVRTDLTIITDTIENTHNQKTIMKIQNNGLHHIFSFPPHSTLLGWLCLLHILIIATSNYLVQIPVQFMNVHATLGTFTYPFIFLVTDLTVRLYGSVFARQVISVVMLPALLLSYLVSVLFYEGQWSGFAMLMQFNSVVARIALASFMAYVVGQLMDIFVFNGLRKLTWWIAPFFAMIIGNAIDTLVFYFIAFYKSADTFMAEHWVEIGVVDYLFKLFVCIILFLPLYRIFLSYLLKQLQPMTNSN